MNAMAHDPSANARTDDKPDGRDAKRGRMTSAFWSCEHHKQLSIAAVTATLGPRTESARAAACRTEA